MAIAAIRLFTCGGLIPRTLTSAATIDFNLGSLVRDKASE